MSYTIMHTPVHGGDLTVGTWGCPTAQHTVLLIHGVTASHRAWDQLGPQLAEAGYYVVAPDLRGRGRSTTLPGPYGMQQHAQDMAQIINRHATTPVTVMGHSMGGFVGLSLAHFYPKLVQHLVLVDGGLPLAVPTGLDADEVIQLILGPTAQRLAQVFDTVEDYLAFWRAHPGFQHHWEPHYDTYFAYDLTEAPDGFTPATSYTAARDDTVDLVQGTTITAALEHLDTPTLFVTCPRGLFDETPGLYSPQHLTALLNAYPQITHQRVPEVNHYTIVMGQHGANVLTQLLHTQRVLNVPAPKTI